MPGSSARHTTFAKRAVCVWLFQFICHCVLHTQDGLSENRSLCFGFFQVILLDEIHGPAFHHCPYMMEESNPLPSLDTKSELEIHKLKLQLFKASQEPVLSTTKRKRVILEEEEYTDRIESIIERDFYPDVTQLRFELEYQDALEKNDYDRLLILGKQRLEANHPTVPKDTPATFETPLTQDADFVCPVKLDPR